MALNNSCNSSLAFQRIDILRVISQQFIVLFQVMDKSVTQGRFEFSRINFLSKQVEQMLVIEVSTQWVFEERLKLVHW
jgi:hypothetical protein